MRRVAPRQDRLVYRLDQAESDEPIPLAMLNINCEHAAGDVLVTVEQAGAVIETLQLSDNGENGDTQASDGVYSLAWAPTQVGEFSVRMAGETVTVVVTAAP